MLSNWDPKLESMLSDADLSSSKFLAVKSSGNSDIALCGAGEAAIGVLTTDVYDGSTTARRNTVQTGGTVKIYAGGTCTRGALLMVDSNGKAVDATDGNYAIGLCKHTAANGELTLVDFAVSYLETT